MSGGIQVIISYKKLWKLLIDRDLLKKDLIAMSGISPSSVTKLGHNENVNTAVLIKICQALDCNIDKVMDIICETQNEDCHG